MNIEQLKSKMTKMITDGYRKGVVKCSGRYPVYGERESVTLSAAQMLMLTGAIAWLEERLSVIPWESMSVTWRPTHITVEGPDLTTTFNHNQRDLTGHLVAKIAAASAAYPFPQVNDLVLLMELRAAATVAPKMIEAKVGDSAWVGNPTRYGVEGGEWSGSAKYEIRSSERGLYLKYLHSVISGRNRDYDSAELGDITVLNGQQVRWVVGAKFREVDA